MANLAAVLYGTHDIRLEERAVPQPGPREVLIEVHSVGVCGSDVHYYEHGRIADFVVEQPLVLGHEASGVVVETASSDAAFAVGDRVMGLFPEGTGTLAVTDERLLVKVPAGWSHTSAATASVAGSMRVTMLALRLATHTAPAPTAIPEGPPVKPRRVLTTVLLEMSTRVIALFS